MTITQTNLAELYVSFFNRAPDSAGLAYWVDQLDKGALSLEDISKNWMSEQAEGLAKYPVELNHTDFITHIYQATLGRAPDAEGLAYWQDQLTNNSVGRDVFLAAVINGAKANSSAQGVLDAATLSNKATAGVAFADKGLNDLTLAGQVVASVNSNPNTLAAAQAVIKLVPATAASVTPALITLLSKTFESIINLNAKAPGEVGDLATYLTAVANQASGTTDLSTLLNSVSNTVTKAATDSAALDNPASLAGDAVAAATPSTGGGGGGVPATPSFTLAEALANQKLPQAYTLIDAKADLGSKTVVDAAVAISHAQAVFNGASNHASLTLEVTYTLSDTLANIQAADSAVKQGATSYALTDANVDLGVHTVAEVAPATAAAQAVVNGASNHASLTLEATYTLADTLANIANPDNSAIVTGHSYTLTDDTGSLGTLSVADATLVNAASNHDSYNYSISDTILAANGQNFTTGFTGNTGVNLTGSNGDQTVTGSAFADIIAGGAGADTLTGGNGADTFVFTTATDSVVGSFDRITDFVSGSDKIQTGVAGGGNSLNQGAFYTETGTGSLIDDITNAVINGNMQGAHLANANDIYVVSITGIGAGTYVYQDANGDETVGADELVIQLAGVSIPLAAGDFIA